MSQASVAVNAVDLRSSSTRVIARIRPPRAMIDELLLVDADVLGSPVLTRLDIGVSRASLAVLPLDDASALVLGADGRVSGISSGALDASAQALVAAVAADSPAPQFIDMVFVGKSLFLLTSTGVIHIASPTAPLCLVLQSIDGLATAFSLTRDIGGVPIEATLAQSAAALDQSARRLEQMRHQNRLSTRLIKADGSTGSLSRESSLHSRRLALLVGELASMQSLLEGRALNWDSMSLFEVGTIRVEYVCCLSLMRLLTRCRVRAPTCLVFSSLAHLCSHS